MPIDRPDTLSQHTSLLRGGGNSQRTQGQETFQISAGDCSAAHNTDTKAQPPEQNHREKKQTLELRSARVSAYAQYVSFLLGEACHVSKPEVHGHVTLIPVRIRPYLSCDDRAQQKAGWAWERKRDVPVF